MTDADATTQAPSPEPCKPGGKRLSDVAKTRDYATGKASDVARNSAFAGFALIWVLTKEGKEPIPTLLLIAALLLAIGLLADFLQYAYNSKVWRDFYNREYMKHNSDDALIDIPDDLSDRTYHLFYAKIIFFAVGFLFLLIGTTTCIRVA